MTSNPPIETPVRLYDELTTLHASYTVAVNTAVEHDDLAAAERLAQEYDAAAVQLVAEREGRTDLLPLVPAGRRGGRLQRWLGQVDRHTLWAFNAPSHLNGRRAS